MGANAAMQLEPEAEASGQVSGNGQYVTFSCNQRNYGIDIMAVREIRSWSPTTELPDQPHGACGVLDIRGEVIQVFDLNVLLGGGQTKATEGHVVIVVAIEGATFGILADAVSDIIEIGEHDMRAAPPSRTGGAGVVSGVAKHEDKIVAVLDLTVLTARRPAEAV